MLELSLIFLLVVGLLVYFLRYQSKKIHDLQSKLNKKELEEDAHLNRVLHRAEILHRLVDGIEDGLLVLNQNGEVIFSNKRAAQFFLETDQIVKKSIQSLVPDQRMGEMITHAISQRARAQRNFLISGWQGRKDEEDRFYEIEVLPIQREDPDNQDDVYLVIFHDQTEKYKLDKIRQDFVANASHELRTPLSIIIGYLENLMDGDLISPEEVRRAYQIMKKHGDRLATIVEELLVISRMESGDDLELDVEEFDFNECTQDVLHRLSPVIAAKGADIRVSFESNIHASLRGDRFYWDQILFNLVGNALKENDGENLQIDLRLRQEQKVSVVEVRDNGVGIPQRDLPFVFKRFYRVSRTRSPEVRGTGLGLSIVKRAVEAHGGKISVQSQPGVETVFTIIVPR